MISFGSLSFFTPPRKLAWPSVWPAWPPGFALPPCPWSVAACASPQGCAWGTAECRAAAAPPMSGTEPAISLRRVRRGIDYDYGMPKPDLRGDGILEWRDEARRGHRD